MSNMPGNPNYESSFGSLMRIEGKTLAYAESENTLRGAQVTATLALAYEQRTANLIAYWNALAGDAEPWQDTLFQRELDDMHRDIRTRLGRTAEVPK